MKTGIDMLEHYRKQGREQNYKWAKKNKDKVKKYRSEWNKKQTTKYVVYVHINLEEDTYIGSGNNLRPYQFTSCSRSKLWYKSFSDDCQVHVIAEFKDRESARELEKSLIQSIGLSNLVNVRA